MKKTLILMFLILATAFSWAQTKRKIAYSSDNSSNNYYQIFVADEDGSNPKQITNLPFDCFRPRWSPDGTKIIFYSQTYEGYSTIRNIYLIVNADTDTPEEPLFIFSGYNPEFLPDNFYILFNSDHEGINTLYIYDAETNEDIRLWDNYATQFTLSKNGYKIAFSGYVNWGEDKSIIILDLEDETEDFQKISVKNYACLNPDFSSDNSKVVFSAFNNELKGTIYLYSEGNMKPLSKGIASADYPKFSPDDSRIAFIGDSETLYIMNADGTNIKPFNIKGGTVENFRWVDNNRIIYDAYNDEDYSIGILDLTTFTSKFILNKGSNRFPDIQSRIGE
ncbi:MAG: TolB family protein [Ignavibacteria bacterium]